MMLRKGVWSPALMPSMPCLAGCPACLQAEFKRYAEAMKAKVYAQIAQFVAEITAQA